jgi:cytidylate kinase
MLSLSRRITIAVDGFSSCGKSTFAREIASQMGYRFIDTGAMYRAVTLYAMRRGAIVSGSVDCKKLTELLDGTEIDFRFNPSRGASDTYLCGEPVEGQIRTIEVSNYVSEVSGIAEVRTKLVAMQQRMGRDGGVVMDGRDIGTAVFPHAEIKIFMTADMAVRVERRYLELRARGEEVSREAIERNIRERDEADQSRKLSPLRMAYDALLLDNSRMTLDEEMEWFGEQLCRLR